MFAHLEYSTSVSPTLADFNADIVNIIAGETVVGNLACSDLDVGNSYIQNTVPSGWSIYDSDTGVANRFVLRAPCDGDASQYKYLVFNLYSASGYFQFTYFICESWDIGTNVATNATTTETNISCFRLNWAGVQGVEIFANPRMILIRPTGTYSKTIIPIMEFTRNHPCFAVGSGYVPAVSMHQPAMIADSIAIRYAYVPRCINNPGTADITNLNVSVGTNGMAPTHSDNWWLSYQFRYVEADADDFKHMTAHVLVIENPQLIGAFLGTSAIADYWWISGNHATHVNADLIDGSVHRLDGIGNVTMRRYNNGSLLQNGSLMLTEYT